jgi:hypothetical protein
MVTRFENENERRGVFVPMTTTNLPEGTTPELKIQQTKPRNIPSQKPIIVSELEISFRSFKVSAKGLLAVILAFSLMLPLTVGIGYRVATSDFSVLQAALGKGISYIASNMP